MEDERVSEWGEGDRWMGEGREGEGWMDRCVGTRRGKLMGEERPLHLLEGWKRGLT